MKVDPKATSLENDAEPMVKYHPFIKKVVPSQIIEIAKGFNLNQYLLMFLLTAIGMGVVVLIAIVISKLTSG